MSQEESAASDGIEVEDDDETAIADLDEAPNALGDVRAVEVDLCGHNTRCSESGHGETTFKVGTPVRSITTTATVVSAPANSPLDILIDPDTVRTVESSPLCAFEMAPLVGRLCLEDLEE